MPGVPLVTCLAQVPLLPAMQELGGLTALWGQVLELAELLSLYSPGVYPQAPWAQSLCCLQDQVQVFCLAPSSLAPILAQTLHCLCGSQPALLSVCRFLPLGLCGPTVFLDAP